MTIKKLTKKEKNSCLLTLTTKVINVEMERRVISQIKKKKYQKVRFDNLSRIKPSFNSSRLPEFFGALTRRGKNHSKLFNNC